MIGYASRTGTRSNLAALREADWRLLVSAAGVLRAEGFRYALDNGAWSAFKNGTPFDVGAFERAVDLLGAGADWVVCPDIVADYRGSLTMAEAWLPRLVRHHVLIAVQDGATPDDVRPWLGPRVGLFLGGSPATNWKERTARMWGELARERGCYFHVGRVNSMRRIDICAEAGADSFDGTSATVYHKTLPRLDRAVRQTSVLALLLPTMTVDNVIARRAHELLAELQRQAPTMSPEVRAVLFRAA